LADDVENLIKEEKARLQMKHHPSEDHTDESSTKIDEAVQVRIKE
jgi:hypothetical protein